MSLDVVLEQYRVSSSSERNKGDRFERLMQAYLQTDPQYTSLLKTVWLWNDFPSRNYLGSIDTGIDLVALTHEGEYWAIQCKFFSQDSVINKPAVDSFLATSGRTFTDENSQTVRFSHRLWISTTNQWGANAEEAIRNQTPSVSRLNLSNLQEAPIDWEKLSSGIYGEASRTPKKSLYPHQREALEKTHESFKIADRGKLIMACGTGKTFTSLRIAENETNGDGLILFLVPSIALLAQTLREWSANAKEILNAVCICSDPKASSKGKKNIDSDDFSVLDLALPASTDVSNIVKQLSAIRLSKGNGMTVVFSTYQSIDVIAQTQKQLLNDDSSYGVFDLIVCDEAHRTTGVILVDKEESAFTKVHDDNFIQAKKRLYMTATPRLYSDDVKSKANQAEAILCSMDDPMLYGDEIYRIGFGQAVEQGLLTDYKVLILTIKDADVPPVVQEMLANEELEINTDDLSKLIGCINALSKQFAGDDGETKKSDPNPMRRAVAFCQSISASKKITNTYNSVADKYINALPPEKRETMVSVASKHMDGTLSAPIRDEMLGWLKASSENNECRILTNVRVLSEGVDVPSLDAVLFLSAKNSQVDVVQSVGRVMRKSPDKKYGYIIIPIIVPSDVEPDIALDKNDRYKVVWTVLNALRAHDDRFNATVNKIELNKKRTTQIVIGRPNVTFDERGNAISANDTTIPETANDVARQLSLQFEQLQSVIFARMVKKVGDRRYWEQWAKDVAIIAERQVERIKFLLSQKKDERIAFDNFLEGLQRNINPSINEAQAVDMLAQHIITRPIFEALFEGYSFVKSNAISTAMQKMLDILDNETLPEESDTLQRFYESVKKRATGIDNAEGKQRIIIELYDKFFKTAFPKMVEQLGIVYTPIEVVDFIIHSVNDVLKMEFDRTLSDENVHILDPFTGTGTFMTRLLQSGLIESKDLMRKYHKELHANEIVLLAYYIAAVNIENAYHDQLSEENKYTPFEGIVLTDTFQLGEIDESERLFSEMFPQNSARVARQKKSPLRVIIGNPPYSAGQKSANDNAQNQKYSRLDAKIRDTYAKESRAILVNALYDSYIKAFRWSADRLDPQHGGIIAFISNGGWVDANGMDGFRKALQREFTAIWVVNLRGNARTSGELRRQEGGNVFDSGSRTPVTITFLVKNPAKRMELATIYYHDIGDYLNREEKLARINQFGSLTHAEMQWTTLQPDEQGDWLAQKVELPETFISIGDKGDKKNTTTFFIPFYSRGLMTCRDAWCYNSSKSLLEKNISDSIAYFNSQVMLFEKAKKSTSRLQLDEFLVPDSRLFHWDHAQKEDIQKFKRYTFTASSIRSSFYRPFFKQWAYFSQEMNNRVYQLPKLFPDATAENFVICVSGIGGSKEFSALMSNVIPDLQLQFNGQCFPLYYYEKHMTQTPTLWDATNNGGTQAGEYVRKDGISNYIWERAKERYGRHVTKEAIFYYVYGYLHHPLYRETFANNLKKELPRLPLVEEVDVFWAFSRFGRELAKLHTDYEQQPPHPQVKVTGAESQEFRVEKMRFVAKDEKDTILYNHHITISNIPAEAYQYVVNGKSAIEWVMERYAITTHKDSGIKNDPNDWAKEVGNPRYILDLLLSIINISVQTVDIVNNLPKITFEEITFED